MSPRNKKQKTNATQVMKVPASIPLHIPKTFLELGATKVRWDTERGFDILGKSGRSLLPRPIRMPADLSSAVALPGAVESQARTGDVTGAPPLSVETAGLHIIETADGAHEFLMKIPRSAPILRAPGAKNEGEILYQRSRAMAVAPVSEEVEKLPHKKLLEKLTEEYERSSIFNAGRALENVAFHDFSYYEYLLPPMVRPKPGPLDDWERYAHEYASNFARAHRDAILDDWWDDVAKYLARELIDLERRRLQLLYPFDIFHYPSWNLGLRLVYRQEWKPLGVQRGEIVRTIPLGPKQTEKVSTKLVRRSKIVRTVESLIATETLTETADSTKDSSEIVNEAASTFKWNVEAEASASIGFASASVKGSAGGEEADKSRLTNNHLSETMKKTASRIRRETKVMVSTEGETTFEAATASEIQNPNDEIPVTYVYSKMQRQYEIFTRLAEASSVIFIAERVPEPTEIDANWVWRYDWIISKVLLDDSYREALNAVRLEPEPGFDDGSDAGLTAFEEMFKEAKGKLAKFEVTQQGGLTVPDVFGPPQTTYREALKEQAQRKRAEKVRKQQLERLYQHIRDNILHYCRAIWSAEDPEQRLLRYKKLGLRIPTVWHFKSSPTGKALIWKTLGEILGVPSITIPVQIPGDWEPDISDPTTLRPVEEMINPAGPIGFAGNYAVFYLKPDPSLDIFNDMLQSVRAPYLDEQSPDPSDLLDPALRVIRNTYQVPAHIDDDDRKEMLDYLPDLKDALKKLEGNDEAQQALLKRRFHDFLYRREFTRRFLVETNNLMLDLEVGSGSALEPFKRLHRYIDVLKADEEREALVKKNKRRDALKERPGEYDPDIEKVVIVGDGANAFMAGHAAAHEATGTTPGRPATSSTTPATSPTSPASPSTTPADSTSAEPGSGGTL